MNNLSSYARQLESNCNRNCLGYESGLDFSYGFAASLLCNKLINRKEYNALIKSYANHKTVDTHWIDQGRLVIEND